MLEEVLEYYKYLKFKKALEYYQYVKFKKALEYYQYYVIISITLMKFRLKENTG